MSIPIPTSTEKTFQFAPGRGATPVWFSISSLILLATRNSRSGASSGS